MSRHNKESSSSQIETAPQKIDFDECASSVVPGLVLAWSGSQVRSADRAPLRLRKKLSLGRSSSNSWCIDDSMLSRHHFEIEIVGKTELILRDLGSSNGTFVDGFQVTKPRKVTSDNVIRAGNCIFMILEDFASLKTIDEDNAGGFAGRFHSPSLVADLKTAARTKRHIIIEGESGTGKELAARMLDRHFFSSTTAHPFVVYNGALFSSEQDAVAGLFGVAKGGFTGVQQRIGAVEQARKGTLFLDEVHNLPIRVQRSLLRFVEDGVLQRLGDSSQTQLDVRVILGTNCRITNAIDEKILAYDLVARLHQVELPPLRERRADIPDIFIDIIKKSTTSDISKSLSESFDVKLIDQMMRLDYTNTNVRQLQDIASYVIARFEENIHPNKSLSAALSDLVEQFKPSVPDKNQSFGSLYDLHRQEIIDSYKEVDGNLSKLEKKLRESGIKCSRQWLAKYLDQWGIRSVRKRSTK